MELLSEAPFWLALGKIIWVNILLSGDNAVVIALAARNLPPAQRQRAVIFGSAAAIALRVVLTLFAVSLLQYPYLKLIGAVLLLWVGIQLLQPEDDDDNQVHAAEHLWSAVRTILVADLVMSMDNVIAVAGAAESGPPAAKFLLLTIGLGLSIPLIIAGSQLLMVVMQRWPLIITVGAGLLGYVAGEMIVTDKASHAQIAAWGPKVAPTIEFSAALLVVAVGKILAKQRSQRAA